MTFQEFFHLFLKYAIFGVVIFLVVYKIPSKAVEDKDNILITLVSIAVFMLLEMTSGWFTQLKNLICGCKSTTTSSDAPSVDNSLVI